jgi:hypothetical protein
MFIGFKRSKKIEFIRAQCGVQYCFCLTTNILEAETVLFAEGTNILIQAEDGKVLEQKINSTMEVLYNWFDTNELFGDKY